MKKWIAGLVAAVVSIGLFVWQDALMSREGFTSITAMKEDGWWCIYERERVPRKDATELIAADGMLYLFYEDVGYVNVYSDEGVFQWGCQVEAISNGVGGIGYRDGILFIDGKSGIYALRGRELVMKEVRASQEGYAQLRRIVREPSPVTDRGYTYYYNAEAGQITRAMPGQALEVVVQLPVKNPNVDFLIFANLFLWFGFASWFRYADEEIPVLTELVRKRRNRLR